MDNLLNPDEQRRAEVLKQFGNEGYTVEELITIVNFVLESPDAKEGFISNSDVLYQPDAVDELYVGSIIEDARGHWFTRTIFGWERHDYTGTKRPYPVTSFGLEFFPYTAHRAVNE